MTNRNDLEVAHSRIESLERETRALAEQNAILTARLEAPVPKAPQAIPPTTTVVHLPADAETIDEPVATWPVTVLVAVLSLAIAAAIIFARTT